MKINISITSVGQAHEYSIVIDDDTPLATPTQALDDYIAKLEAAAAYTPLARPATAEVETPIGEFFRLDPSGIPLEHIIKQTTIDGATLEILPDGIEVPTITVPTAEIEAPKAALAQKDARIATLRETIHSQDILIADLTQPPAEVPQQATPEIGGLPVVEPEPTSPQRNGKPPNGHEPVSPPPLQRNSTNPKMSKVEFDRLVRSEMKRLAPAPNVIPGYATWNEKRDRRLPLMLATIRRYDCNSLTELATKLGMDMLPGRTQIVDLEVDTDDEDGDE